MKSNAIPYYRELYGNAWVCITRLNESLETNFINRLNEVTYPMQVHLGRKNSFSENFILSFGKFSTIASQTMRIVLTGSK